MPFSCLSVVWLGVLRGEHGRDGSGMGNVAMWLARNEAARADGLMCNYGHFLCIPASGLSQQADTSKTNGTVTFIVCRC